VNNSTTREVCVGRKKTGPKIQVGVAASCAETRHSFFEREKRILIRVWHSKRLAAKEAHDERLPNFNFEQARSLKPLPHFADASGSLDANNSATNEASVANRRFTAE